MTKRRIPKKIYLQTNLISKLIKVINNVYINKLNIRRCKFTSTLRLDSAYVQYMHMNRIKTSFHRFLLM